MSASRSGRLLTSTIAIFLSIGLVIALTWALDQNALADADLAAQPWTRVWSANAARFSADPLTAAWEQARDAGSYSFTSDVVQITIPTAKVTNVGRPSRTEQLYLEGQSDLEAEAVEFQLWTQGGSAHSAESGLSVRAADGKSYIRQGTGDWEESSSFSNVIAPASDFMAYLAAARDITSHEPETRAGITFTRYSFQIDGPTFAVFARNQMEAAMRARGELPEGVHFELSSYYHDMTGDGELWIRENGLPLRQVLNIRFPEQNGESVQAQIKVDFSQFGQTRFVGGEFVQIDPASTAGSVNGVWTALQRQAPAAVSLLALLPCLALIVLVVYYRRTRMLQTALSLAVIASMLVGPISSTLKLTTFLDAQTARAAEQSATQTESAMLRELRAQDSAPQFNPHQNPLEAAAAVPAFASAMAGSAAPFTAPSLQSTGVLTIENTSLDTDQDGLNDFIEQRIGTSTVFSDTDGDQISDWVEVIGFTTGAGTVNEKKWYPNPLAVDSNDDGIADTLEYDVDGNNQPDDTDGDGTPDLFDNDNDDDGIPDHIDLAPFAKSTANGNPPYGESSPLLLKINNLTVQSGNAAVHTFVDFQIRPVSAQQLQVATNLLDWPQDDEGQIQDIDDQPSDMTLLPMLEVRIPNGAAMLPPESDLEPYGISVGNDEVSGGKVAYIPLNLVTDPQSGERVAFSGRMRYLPQTAWQQPHSVRMVWVVQVANDYACDPNSTGYDATKGYCANQPQIVHRYYEDWILTGLNVIEEHGADMAIIYEDPGARSANDGAMWLLTSVLGARFVATVVDNGGNAQRDLTIDNLDAKLDRSINSSANEVVYGLPNNFHVVKAQYATFDEAIYKVGTETTTSVLNSTFTDPAQKPLLLYAYETNLRSIGLDASRIDNSNNSYASVNGAQLTMDFHPSGQPNTSIKTTAGFKWTPYCGNGSPPVWDVCDPVAYWQELEARHGAQTLDPDTLQLVSASSIDPDVAKGEMIATQLYALSMLQGISAPVSEDNGSGVQLVSGIYASESDSQVTDDIRSGLLLGTAVAKWAANREILKGLTNFTRADGSSYSHSELIKRVRLGRIDTRGTFSTIGRFPGWLKGGTYVAMGLVLAGTAVAAGFALAGYEEAELPAQIAIGAIQSAALVGVPIRTVFVATQETGKSAIQVLRGLSSEIGYTQKAGAIGAGLAIGITWGIFIANATANNMVPFSVAFNHALASTIASTILIILLTIIALNPVGLIIVGIIAVLDILLTLLCEYGGADSLRFDFTSGCFTISGAVTATIVKALYSYDLMIDTNRADLVTTGGPDIELTNPNLGYVGGNTISVTFPITTHAVHKDPDPSAGIYVNFYLWLFSKNNLRSSTFKYSLTAPNPADITGLERDQMTNQWMQVAEDHKYVLTPMYGGKASTIPNAAVVALPPQAGLNQPVEFYQNMGFAIPAYECWLVPVPLGPSPATPVCYTRTFKGKNSTLIDSLRLDILPATLNEFILTVQKEDGGFGLAWDAAFRSLPDEDGDGLLSSRYNGLDPDDRKWDADSDGLSDRFEREQQQAGVNMSPIQIDTDSDGLTDAQELQFGTNPGVADSDNDGLKDGEEVWHEVYDLQTGLATGHYTGGLSVEINSLNPLTVRVSSNPNARDSDGDGVSDAAEYQLAKDNGVDGNGKPIRIDDNNVPFHPNVVNTPPVRIYVTSDAVENRYVKPGQQFVYTTTVVATAPLDPGVLDLFVLNGNGASSSLLGVPSQRYALPFDSLTFSTAPTITRQTAFTVNGNAPTQTSVSVNNTVRTQLAGSGLGPWQWNPTAGGTWSFSGAQNQPAFTAATPTTFDRPDRYLMTTKALIANYGAPGDIRTQYIPSAVIRELDVDTFNRTIPWTPTTTATLLETSYLYAPNAPDVACNDSGNCMVVWDHIDNCSTATINWIKILNEGNDGSSSGIEPVIYLVRDFNDNNPTDGGYELLWNPRPSANGGNNMQKNEQRGPNAYGFPISFDFCDNDRIVIYESDNQDNLNDFNLTKWNEQDFAGSNFVQPGGFWNETGDEAILLWDDATCNGCRINLSITSVSKQIRKVAGALLAPDGTVLVPQHDLSSYAGNPYTVEFYRPTVASDGKDFLVAWERTILPLGAFRSAGNTTAQDAIVTRRFAGDGSPLSNNTLVTGSEATTTIAVQNHQLAQRSRARLVLNWVGDRYQLTRLLLPFQVKSTGEWGQGITIRDLDGNGQLIPGSFAQLLGSARNFIDDSYDWAYDPINKRSLLLYWDNINYFLQGRLFEPTGPGSYMVSVPQNWFFTNVGDSGSPQVEYDPTTKGWLVGWTGSNWSNFEALDAEATSPPLGNRLTLTDQPVVNSNALACPAPQSLPVVDLRFEELPGATTFIDRSGYGNNASCSPGACPSAGAPGARRNNGDAPPLSAYALEFTGTNNSISLTKPNQLSGSFSLALWYKADAASFVAAPFVVDSNQPNGFGLFVRNDQGQVEWYVANKGLLMAWPGDGDWHFVVGTYERSTGAVNLYIDGVPVKSDTVTQVPILGSNIEIRGANTLVSIDHLQIYPSALSASTVSAIYGRSNSAFCIATSANAVSQAVRWNKLSVTREETFTPIEKSEASIITVDNDAPTTSVTGAQYVDIDANGSAILTIGGTAQDPTSGVGSVSVSVDGLNNGAYQPATGKETWVYQFPVTEGAYTVRAKATDILGNVGNPSADKVIIADATPPQVTINTIANPVKPVLNGSGQWQVSLSGTAFDPNVGSYPGSGVYPDSVEVLLTGAGGVVVSDQWQTAIYDENSKVWTVDYTFPAARIDVTGVYTVSVRAQDRAGSNGGNSTGNAGATAILQLDHTGPSASLSNVDASRQLITGPVTIGGPVLSPFSGIDRVEVAFTPVEQIAALPLDVSAAEAQAILDAADPNRWLQASLVQQGAGAMTTTWSLLVPDTLEGEYQIDLRGTDMSANVLVTSNVWRGIIDLLAPRVSIVRTASGYGYTSDTNVLFEHVMYSCVATDRYLVAGAFTCPGVTLSSQATRVFNTDPRLQALFPDRTLLEQMEKTTYRYEASAPLETIAACDLFGHCSTANTGQTVAAAQNQVTTAAVVVAAAAAQPQALVISPVEGLYAASDGNLPVTIAAEAAASLQQVTVELDNTVVRTYTFEQSDNITRIQRTVAIPNVTEGVHMLVAKATDWTGAVQTTLYPVTFTLDAADPAVTLDTDLLRLADTWALGSDMLRFNGTASDSVGLAAVQIKIVDAPFAEAVFDENSGTWSTAQLVRDPEGKVLKVTVRAVDRAGRMTYVTGDIGVNLTPTETTITPPNTTITPTVVTPGSNSVSVSFAGVDGTNAVAAFECRLDDGPFQPCVSPQQYEGLHNGV
ncbi:MAG: LamG domain-containing protein, partial [Caldilineaceae bacterium]|nr:LamG domain-containing protein [Caldilineaceae bacterium]